MRWARRIGRRERVKFAEANRVEAESGGRPCLGIVMLVGRWFDRIEGVVDATGRDLLMPRKEVVVKPGGRLDHCRC